MKKTNKIEKHHLLMYVEDCSPKIKKFYSTEKMSDFIEKFQKKHPDHLASDSGWWIDYCVMDVSGPVHFFCDGIKVK
jgi:hypothetical protein